MTGTSAKRVDRVAEVATVEGEAETGPDGDVHISISPLPEYN